MAESQELGPKIATIESKNTLRGMIVPGVSPSDGAGARKPSKKVLSADYQQAFHFWVTSGGQTTNAALYEGSAPGGGYAVPISVDDQIVPLAPQEMAIRRLATVIPTTNDIKIPRKTTFSTAAARRNRARPRTPS